MTHTRLGQIKDCLRRDCQLRSSILFPYESRGGSSDFGLPTSDFRLPTSDFRLPTSNFRPHTSNFRLQTWQSANSGFLISDRSVSKLKGLTFGPPTSHFSLPTSDFRLPTSDFRLPIADFWFLTSHFRLPTSDFRFPTSDFQTSNFWLDSSVWLDCRSIHHAGINAQSQSSVERTAVPFSPQKRTTKLALEKATKQPWLPRKEIRAPVKRLEKH